MVVGLWHLSDKNCCQNAPHFPVDTLKRQAYTVRTMNKADVLKAHYKRIGFLGGTARAKNLSPAVRSAQASYASRIRWRKIKPSIPEPAHGQ